MKTTAPDTRKRWLQPTLLPTLLLAGSFILPFLTHPKVSNVNIYDFRFNAYAVLSIFSVTTSLFLLIYVGTRVKEKTDDSTWLSLFLISIVIFGLGEALQRLSGTVEAAIFWAQLSTIGAVLISPSCFLFSRFYTDPGRRHYAATLMLFIGSLTLLFFQANNGTIYSVTSSHLYPWGYNTDVGPAYITNALWISLLVIWALTTAVRYRKRSQNPVIKKQAGIIALALLVPLIAGLIADMGLPMAGITNLVPPLTSAAFTVTAILLVYGTTRYKLFRFSPAVLSTNILNTMHDGVIVTNNTYRVEFMNNEASKLFTELTDHEALLSDVFTGTDFKQELSALENVSDTKAITISNLSTTINGERKFFNAAVSLIVSDNTIEGYIWALSDITDLHETQDLLRKEKESVEHTVEVRTRELREAQERLKETDKLKTEFVMLTSHNLRTPFTIVKGNVDMLSSIRMEEDQRQKLLEDVQANIGSLGDLIEDLLAISTIEAGAKLIHESVPLKHLLDPLMEAAKAQAPSRNNKFVRKLPEADKLEKTVVQINEKRLRTALRNIIDNSFKFTEKGIVTFTTEVHANSVVFTVEDTGMGITADELPKLFQKFHRATDALQYDYAGEGIGLYLSKITIEEHGGTIKVESEPGKGTTVTITLPRT